MAPAQPAVPQVLTRNQAVDLALTDGTQAALAAATAVSLPAEQLAALKGTAIAAALHAAREQRIETLLCERPG